MDKKLVQENVRRILNGGIPVKVIGEDSNWYKWDELTENEKIFFTLSNNIKSMSYVYLGSEIEKGYKEKVGMYSRTIPEYTSESYKIFIPTKLLTDKNLSVENAISMLKANDDGITDTIIDGVLKRESYETKVTGDIKIEEDSIVMNVIHEF